MATRPFNESVTGIMDSIKLKDRFDNMLTKVSNMINTQGPIYSVWIRFQIGKNNPITFNTASQDIKENLIADLNIQKTGAGVTNSFTLTVRYDPFNYGQNTQDKIEALDELLAEALSWDFSQNDTSDALRGYIQYGYNNMADMDMVSPKYEFYLTSAKSVVEWSSGMLSYTFEGTTLLSTDCDFVVSFNAVENKSLIEVVAETLYKYYGNSSNKPSRIGDVECIGDDLGYNIDIPDSIFDDSPTVSLNASANVSPWTYCTSILQDQMAQSDIDSGEYSDTTTIKFSDKPRYILYITDSDRTIHLSYNSPRNSSNQSNQQLNWLFTWNQQNNNLIVQWEPNVDLSLYLIQKMKYLRAQRQGIDTNSGQAYRLRNYLYNLEGGQEGTGMTADEFVAKHMNEQASDAYEYYDAKLTLVGIPADAPLSCEIKVIPRVLESVSRTQGIYIITGSSDQISTKGVYTTTLELFRIKNIDGTVPQPAQSTQSSTSSSSDSYSNSDTAAERWDIITNTPSSGSGYGGGFSSGGGNRWTVVVGAGGR